MTKLDKMLYIKIGEKLRKERELRKFSLEQVADAVGLTKKTIQRYETAESRISTSNLQQICKVLEIDSESISSFFYFNFDNENDDADTDFADITHISLAEIEAKQNPYKTTEFSSAADALKFILEQPIFASNVGYDPKKMTDEQLIKLANKILRFTKMEVEDMEEIDPEDI